MKAKRFFAGLSAFAIAAAMLPVSAFADDITIDQNSTDKKGAMTATYDVQAKYTVTIPAGAPIGEDAEHTEETSITASGVVLEEGQKLTVTLSQAANTAKGESAFTAKNGTSAVTYAIKKGGDLIKVGDPVAEFTANGEQALSFYKTGGTPTVAGEHTETLTFGIAVKDAVTTRTVTWNNDDITGSGNSFTKDGVTINAGSIDFEDKCFEDDGTFTTTLGNFTKIEVVVTNGFCDVSGTGWSGNSEKRTWTGNASSVSFSGDIYGDGNGISFVFTIESTN